MQLTTEMIVVIGIAVAGGAGSALLTARATSSQLLGHIKRHCGEIDDIKAALLRKDESTGASFRRTHERLNDHAERLRVIEYQHDLDAREGCG